MFDILGRLTLAHRLDCNWLVDTFRSADVPFSALFDESVRLLVNPASKSWASEPLRGLAFEFALVVTRKWRSIETSSNQYALSSLSALLIQFILQSEVDCRSKCSEEYSTLCEIGAGGGID